MIREFSLISTGKLLAILVFLTLTSCAGLPGKSKTSDAALAGDPQAMWSEGQKVVQHGEQLVSKGEQRLADGRKQVRDGQSMVTEGNERVIQSRLDYQAAASAVGGSSTPKEVELEAKRLKTIGERWENAIDEIKQGNKLVDKGNKNIDRGQADIRDGRAQIESGSVLMRNSQRIRLNEELLPAPDQPSQQ